MARFADLSWKSTYARRTRQQVAPGATCWPGLSDTSPAMVWWSWACSRFEARFL